MPDTQDLVRFEGNLAIANLNEINLSKTIGDENNPLYQMIFEKVPSQRDKPKCQVKVINVVNKSLVSNVHTMRIDELRRVRTKRNEINKDIKDLLGEMMSEDEINKLVGRIIMQVQQEWLKHEYMKEDEPVPAEDPARVDINLVTQALDLLYNPDILNIADKEIEITVKGERYNRVYVFLALIQSFTPEYPQIILVGESSIGKTWIINNVLELFPPEYVYKVGRVSKTAIERAIKLHKIKILYIQEARGKQAAADSIRLSSSSDGGMKALITNAETGEVDEFEVPPLTLITSQTELELHHEDETRMVKIYLDASRGQTREVILFQGEEAERPVGLRRALGLMPNSNIPLIRTAIRLLEKSWDVIIPYQSEVAKVLDTSKIRIKRDHKKIIGGIKASATLHQFQREILKIGKQIWIIANEDDLRNSLEYGEKPITQSFYNIDDLDKEIIKLMKVVHDNTDWATQANQGIHTDAIVEAVNEELGYKRTWTSDRLKRLRDNSMIVGMYEAGGETGKRGYYYFVPDTTYESILMDDIDYDIVKKRIPEWKARIQLDNKSKVDIIFGKIDRKAVEDKYIHTPADDDSADSPEFGV